MRKAAADRVYEGSGLEWEERGVMEFDASHGVTLDDGGDEIDATARGDL